METKTYKAAMDLHGEAGAFSAVFATMNVVDHDKDVTLPGAFTSGAGVVIEPWNHNYDSLPVGKGTLLADRHVAAVSGQFFLETQSGLEHYKVVKAMGPNQEWSYTFQILESEPGTFEGQAVRFLKRLDVWGVAPVTRGAGIGTETTAIKGTPRRQSPSPNMTPKGAITAILGMTPPAVIGGQVDDQVMDLELGELERRVTTRTGTHPTNRDLVREQVLAEYSDDGPPSERWLAEMVAIRLEAMAAQRAARNTGAPSEADALRQARAAVARWAAAPAG